MTVVVDGYALLKAIGSNPQAFPEVRATVDKSAVSIVVAQLKNKALTVEKFRTLASAVGVNAFGLVLDSMDGKAMATLLMKIDKHHPERPGADVTWARNHLRALAGNRVQPTDPVTQPRRSRASKGREARKPTVETDGTFFPQSMQVRPRRRRG
jgi:hypothetical protein